MKVAVALAMIKDLGRAIDKKIEAISAVCVISRDQTPPEVDVMLEELDGLIQKEAELKLRVNRTNNVGTPSVMELLNQQALLARAVKSYDFLIHPINGAMSQTETVTMRTVVNGEYLNQLVPNPKMKNPRLNAEVVARRHDQLARDLREMKNRIQELAWTTDLL